MILVDEIGGSSTEISSSASSLKLAAGRAGYVAPLCGDSDVELGLERFLEGLGLELVRTRVGDRYVVEACANVTSTSEQSGHIS